MITEERTPEAQPPYGFGTVEGEPCGLYGNFHGVPELSKDGEGFVYWKTKQVEHYTFDWRQEEHCEHAEAPDNAPDWSTIDECQSAQELAKHCRHLESLGVLVSTRTVAWFWSWFEAMQPGHAYLEFMKRPRDLYEHATLPGFVFCDFVRYDRNSPYKCLGSRFLRWDGEKLVVHHVEPDNFGGFYHPLAAQGWETAEAGQGINLGVCYATTEGITNLLKRHLVPAGFTGILE